MQVAVSSSPKISSTSLFLDTTAAAQFLGVSKGQIYALVHNRLLPHYQPTGKLFFKADDLRAFVESGRVPAKAR